MKKLISIISLLSFTLLIGVTNLQAQNPKSDKLNNKINTFISYPYLAQQNMEGEVTVSFSVTPKGKLDVLKIDSSNPHLIPFVMRRLNKVNLPLNDVTIGTTQSYIFNFKKEKNQRT